MPGQNELPVNVRVGLVDALSAKLDKINQRFPALKKSVAGVQANFDLMQESSKGFTKSVEGFSKAIVPGLESIGKAFTLGVTLPVAAGAAYSVKKFIDFEDALNEVQGAAQISGDQLKQLGADLQKVSTHTTFSQEELLKLAATAGDVGVRGKDNLEAFSITLAKLGKTAGLAGPDAAEALFQILNLTNTGVDKIGGLGASISALQNTYGVKASKIVDSTQQITRSIGRFGLSAPQILGLATAIAPLGFEAKASAGAVNEAFTGINDAIREGGVKMIGLQRITGMTGDELKKQFKDNPQKVFESFLGGLAKIDAAGGKSSEALQFFGASGDKSAAVLLALSKNIKGVHETQDFANKSFQDGTALNDEYKETTVTLSASLKLLHNNTEALATNLGNNLAPSVKWVADSMSGLIGWFNEHPKVANFAAAVAGFAALLGPTIMGVVGLVKNFKDIIMVVQSLQAAWTFLTTVEYAALLPYILIGAAVIGLIALIWIFRDAIWKGLVAAWDWVIERIMKVIQLMKDVTGFLSQGILKFTPLGALAFGANKVLNMLPGGTPAGPQGAETNAAPTAADSAVSQFGIQTNNAKVDINVRAPQSTSVQSEQNGGFLQINRGMAGAF